MPDNKPDFALRDGVLWPRTIKATQFLRAYYFPPEMLVDGLGVKGANAPLLAEIRETDLTIEEK